MRIAYCTNVRFPSERAHGHQVAAVVTALASLGHEVTVFAPYRRNRVTVDPWTYYGLPRSVRVRTLGRFDAIASPLLPGVLGLWWMNASLRRMLKRLLRSETFDLVYTRTPALLPALTVCGISTVLELHQLPRLRQQRFVRCASACARVVCLTSPMAECAVRMGIPPEKILVEGDAVHLQAFVNTPSLSDARTALALTTDRTVIGYVGRLRTLGMEKGVSIILEALSRDRRFSALIVGGPEADRRCYEAMACRLGLRDDDVRFTGEVPASNIPSMLAAADILAMPFPDTPHYRTNMSPLKMFEYMASGTPILTSDLPTIRDVLSEESAFFCRPGDVDDFLARAQEMREHPVVARTRAAFARQLVERHTWEARMERILRGV